MNEQEAFLAALARARVLAIVRGGFSAERYRAISNTLAASGVRMQEFTVDGPHALGAIREVRAEVSDDLWLGAGTVRTASLGERALAAGARFLVSPGFVAEVATLARDAGVAYLPGVFTATEVEVAVAHGCEVVKLFPAQPPGPAYLAALAAPLAGVGFVPTGGIGVGDVHAFLEAGAVAVGLGSSLIGRGGDPDEIDRRARALEEIVGRGGARGA